MGDEGGGVMEGERGGGREGERKEEKNRAT